MRNTIVGVFMLAVIACGILVCTDAMGRPTCTHKTIGCSWACLVIYGDELHQITPDGWVTQGMENPTVYLPGGSCGHVYDWSLLGCTTYEKSMGNRTSGDCDQPPCY